MIFLGLAVIFAAGCRSGDAVPRPSGPTTDRAGVAAVQAFRDAIPRAAQSADDAQVRRRVLAGEPVDATDALGKTALYYSAVNGDGPLMAFLLDHGANPNFPVDSKSGQTPLFAAISHRHLDGIDTLLRRGADINVRADGGFTPLFAAVEIDWLPGVQLLLDRGARIKAVTDLGDTPLSWADPRDPNISEDSIVAVVKLLLDRGADPTIKNRDGITASQQERSSGRNRAADLIDGFVPPGRRAGTTVPEK